MILEKNLTKDSLLSKIDELLNDDKKIQELKNNASKLGKPNASKDIYELMKKVIK